MERDGVVIIGGDPEIGYLLANLVETECAASVSVIPEDAEAAYQYVVATGPWLVVLASTSLFLNGLDVARKLKSDPLTRPIPIIMLSGLDAFKKRALDAGCDDFIQQPFNIDDFLRAVRRQQQISPWARAS